MNKKGFTLAEVLITLAVVGVVAALTIPSLIQSINDVQYRSAWKKAFSDLNQVNIRLLSDNGGSLKGVFANYIDLKDKYSQYLSYVKKCNSGENCWHNANAWYGLDGTPRDFGNEAGNILNNGNLILYGHHDQNCNHTGYGLPICGSIYIDINGFKGPNIVGKDIYLIWIQENKLTPAGSKDNYENLCNTSNTGLGCAALYLKQ